MADQAIDDAPGGAGSPVAPFDPAPFRRLLWDDASATLNDRERWMRERIVTPHLQAREDGAAASTAASAVSPAAATDRMDAGNNSSDAAPPTPLEIFTGASSHNQSPPQARPPQHLWGLTQTHGGPCGVLAAVQAETVRILLFGRGGGRRDLFYPFLPEAEENYKGGQAAPIGPVEADEGTAMAVGMILARAGTMPDVDASAGESGRSDEAVVRLVLPDGSQNVNTQSTTTTAEGGGATAEETTTPWMQEMLGTAPASSTSTNPPPLTSSSGLAVHVVRAPSQTDMDVDVATSPATKRPRNYSISSVTAAVSTEQQQMAALAGAVASFLLGEGDKPTAGNATTTTQQRRSRSRPLDLLRQPGGVMLLVLSLIATRGIDRIRHDMDDPSSSLTSHFAHTSQELMNLLLTGQAVSNVFDNSMVLSEELTCRGIQRRSAIGYLTQLESLRYCEVGGYYKSPLFPIWVVGSTSHFSVLFGDEQCLRESKSDILLERCQRAFKKVEGGSENGFIPVDKLGDVLDELDLRTKVGGDAGVQTLQAYLEVSGAGIILWDDFWKATSRLSTGSSLERIMSGNDDAMQVDNTSSDGPPLLITQFGEEDKPPAPASAAQSDEELAKRLAEEWGSMPDAPSSDQSKKKSDEEYARELQAKWDAEQGSNFAGMDVSDRGSEGATTDEIPSLSSRPPTPFAEAKPEAEGDSTAKTTGDEAMDDARQPANTHQLDFEKHGESFPLYHYNGLHGGTLTPFRLTRLSPTEAVGASIALSKAGSGHGGGGGDLEDVVRTKWPSSMLNWFGKSPPSID